MILEDKLLERELRLCIEEFCKEHNLEIEPEFNKLLIRDGYHFAEGCTMYPEEIEGLVPEEYLSKFDDDYPFMLHSASIELQPIGSTNYECFAYYGVFDKEGHIRVITITSENGDDNYIMRDYTNID